MLKEGNIGYPFDIHLAPQYWLLKRTALLGMAPSFLDSLTPETWGCLQQDMASKGLDPPGELVTVNANSQNWHRSGLLADLDNTTVVQVCALLQEEYRCLGFELPKLCRGPGGQGSK